MSRHQPDFERFRLAVTRDRLPDRIPTAEVEVDVQVMEAFLGRPLADIETYARFWQEAGYDYIVLQVRGQPLSDSMQMKVAEGELTQHGPEATVSTFASARITDEQSFDTYPWIGPADVYYKDVDLIKDHLPDGMKLVVNHGPIFQSLFRMMGIQALSFATVENPGLVRAIADRVGELSVAIIENLVQREWVGGIWYGDDMAYTEGLLVSPALLREYVFPFLRRMGDLCRRYDKLFILHSDGKLTEVLEDVIACGFQAVHPNEPSSVDMGEMKAEWGDRLAMLGGIDLDLLARGTVAQVADATRSLINQVGPGGGVALGSSNSVAKFVPLANYRAMLETIRDDGAIY